MVSLRMLTGTLAATFERFRGGNGRWRDHILAMFVSPGDLAFDIGAHVGDCVSSLRRLQATVVAVEPQRGPYHMLKILHSRDPHVLLENLAVGAHSGSAEMWLNLSNPSVSTMSARFVEAAQGARGWEGQLWESGPPVAMTTLDALIERYGPPTFCKIDVEGYEAEVLRGLNSAVAALSFEFTTIQRSVAMSALEECERLGDYRYNAALGDDDRLTHPTWLDASAMSRWIMSLPHAANSGDIYAVHADQPR
jgi:FkbM family methyltransferase